MGAALWKCGSHRRHRRFIHLRWLDLDQKPPMHAIWARDYLEKENWFSRSFIIRVWRRRNFACVYMWKCANNFTLHFKRALDVKIISGWQIGAKLSGRVNYSLVICSTFMQRYSGAEGSRKSRARAEMIHDNHTLVNHKFVKRKAFLTFLITGRRVINKMQLDLQLIKSIIVRNLLMQLG